jgi:dihydrolipoamide dehydrogenase
MSERELQQADVVVIGGGPGGYAAAFYAADLGLQTILVDVRPAPGGVCLYEGCIPSKALLHVAEILGEAEHAKEFGVDFAPPKIDIDRLREWKNGIVSKLTGGLSQIARMRGVTFVRGRATFLSSESLLVEGEKTTQIDFKNAILATGSRPTTIPGLDLKSPLVMDSTGGLELETIPKTMLIVGGGYIGLEMGTAYQALGSRVTVVEVTGNLLPGTDTDLVRPLQKRLKQNFEAILLRTKIAGMEETKGKIRVELDGEVEEKHQTFDRVLMSVGRRPNSENLDLEKTGVTLNDQGFVVIDEQCRTHDPRIYAIGDVAGHPMLAHKASREGKVAAGAIAGHPTAFDNQAIPAVVFTDPEIAYCGLTETQARREEKEVKVARFPWAASGRALTLDRTEGFTKILFDPETERVLGVGIVGPGAGELIAEGVLAVEMAAVAEDLALTIHPHPTLSETVMESAESLFGHATHIYRKKR